MKDDIFKRTRERTVRIVCHGCSRPYYVSPGRVREMRASAQDPLCVAVRAFCTRKCGEAWEAREDGERPQKEKVN